MSQVLQGWLKRVQELSESQRENLLLTGSVMTAALIPEARQVADVDYLALGEFDVNAVVAFVLAAVRQEAHDDLRYFFNAHTLTAPYDTFPGVRCALEADCGGTREPFEIDFFWGDPICFPPQHLTVLGVPDVQTCSPQDLWAWKLHGLTEFGTGGWRSKDLFDLACLLELPLSNADLRKAAILAFNTRDMSLNALTNLVLRADWGQADDGARYWQVHLPGVRRSFQECREVVRNKINELWPDRPWLEIVEVDALPDDDEFFNQPTALAPPDDLLPSEEEIVAAYQAVLSATADLPDTVLDALAGQEAQRETQEE